MQYDLSANGRMRHTDIREYSRCFEKFDERNYLENDRGRNESESWIRKMRTF